MERTFTFLKPETIMRGHMGEVLQRIEKKGFNIIAMKLIQMSRSQAEELYEAHREKSFFNLLVSHVTSAPTLLMVLEGPNAVKVMRKLVGATDPADAEAGTIRGDYALDKTCNVVHASDSAESAAREMKIFFKPEELIRYSKPTETQYFFSKEG